MKKFAFLIVALSIGFTAFGHFANVHEPTRATAQDQPKAAGDVRFPTVPVEVLPTPKPAPNAVMKLSLDQMYVIDADIAVMVFDSPRGLVKIAKQAGPLVVRSRFVDGKGVETRHYKGKQVYLVEAAATGKVELIVVPVGAVDETAAIRKTLDVDAGEGPRPPPEPKPPQPDGTGPFGGAAGLHVLVVYESGDKGADLMTRDQYNAVYGKKFRDYIEAKCARVDGTPQRRIWDKDIAFAGESKLWQDAMKRPRSTVPWIAVGNGPAWHEGPLPKTETEIMELLKKYGG